MPLTSVTKDAAKLTLTVVGDYPVPQQRLWDAFADPRQLERFWGPPEAPATFTRHDFKVGGRAEYFLTLPEGKRWSGSWKFTAVNPISSFEAHDGEDNAEDENMPASMRFAFETTPTGSRLTCVTWFESVEAMERTVPGMEEGLRAAMPQLDAVLAEQTITKEHVMKSITTYLHFNGNCRTAMVFYRECFGGELEVVAWPDASGKPASDPKAPVQHSRLAQGDQTLLMASDYPPGLDTSSLGNNFSVFIDCSSNGELEKLFTALSQDGKVTVPPSDMPSGRFGMCDDSFGTSWILNCAKAG